MPSIKIEWEGRAVDNNQLKTDKDSRCGCMLSSSDLLNLIIADEIEIAKRQFQERQWTKIGQKIIIDPFNPQNLTPFSYDLTVGAQIYSSEHKVVRELTPMDSMYLMSSRETIVIKTKEYLALPPCYSASVLPRFSNVIQGIFQSMVKIDPTWYGQLGVAITNLSSDKYPIKLGQSFATLVIYELKTPTEMYLCTSDNFEEPEPVYLSNKLDLKLLEKRISDARLQDTCEIVNNKFKLKAMPGEKEFIELLAFSDGEEWRKAILRSIANYPQRVDSLGLPSLELIKPVQSDV